MTQPQQEPGPGARVLAPPLASRQFTTFLRMRDVSVLDVVRGSAHNTRRLLLGDPSDETVKFVVAVHHGHGGDDPVGNEQTVLQDAAENLRPTIRQSLPRVVGQVEVYTAMTGLVVTAVPGLAVAGRGRRAATAQQLFAAMPGWFAAVWQDTASGAVPVTLGGSALHTVLGRDEQVFALEPALATVRKAYNRVAQYEVPQTLTHGCLCQRHVVVSGAGVGVEDWGLASLTGNPVRDLGLFAANVAGSRLPEVLRGRSGYSAGVRRFMAAALTQTNVPRQLWREVLVLAQLELAVESLEQADPNRMLLLSRALRALRGLDDTEENDTCTR